MDHLRSDAESRPPHFNPKATLAHARRLDVGRRADRPFMILATIADLSLGDLLCKIAFVSTVKDQFDHARLLVRYNDFRHYSSEVVSLSPNIDHAEGIRGELPKWLRPYIRDMRLWRPLASTITGSRRREEAFYDMVIVDSMMSSHLLHTFDDVTPLRVPGHLHDELTARLVELGLDTSAPFVVVHYRDGTYSLKSKNPVRNGEPESYKQAVDHIIDNLDCQVVQIGHPEMTPLPKRDRFIDLSRLPKSFMLQAFAVSKARFLLAGASGPAALGWALATPSAIVDCCTATPPWGHAEHFYLTQELTTPEGEKLRNRFLYERGLLDIGLVTKLLREKSGYSLRRCSGEELAAMASHVHARTSDVTHWRPDRPARPRQHPNFVVWPRQVDEKMTFVDV
jgi:putative glycosyltransferase (TIGR04372 family)